MGEFTITQSEPNNEKLFLYPSGDLSGCTDFDPSTGSTNWNLVDDPEYALDTDDYVSTNNTLYQMDLYEFDNHTTEEGTINYVKEYTVAKAEYIPNTNINFQLSCSPDSICTDYYNSNEKPLTNAWRKHSYVWGNNPKTGSDWSWTDIDSMSLGFRAKSTSPSTSNILDETLRPNGDGDIVQFSGSPYNSTGEKYKNVDESAPNWDTDYIYASTLGSAEPLGLFEVDDPTSFTAANTIKSVTVSIYMKKTTSINSTARIALKTNGTVYYDSTIYVLNSSYTLYSNTWNTNPDTGTDWTLSEVQNLQVGLKAYLVGQSDPDIAATIRATQIFVTVEYYETDAPCIDVAQTYAEVGYTPNSRSCNLCKPSQWTTDHDRATKMLNFWDGSREVYDLYRGGKRAVLRGVEYSSDNSFTPCTRIECVRNLANNGATVTLSDTGMDCLDHDYKIVSFGWNLKSKKPQVYEWIMELEYTEL